VILTGLPLKTPTEGRRHDPDSPDKQFSLRSLRAFDAQRSLR
jgi:hypothetical protein